MRIAIDVRSLMEGRLSGVEEYTVQIIRALLRVAPQHEYRLFYNAFRAVQISNFGPGATLHGWRFPNKIFNTAQWLLAQPRWDYLIKADVFFIPNVRLVPLSPGVPVVTTVHDLSFERFSEFFDYRRRLWHRVMSPQKLIARSQHVIAVSEHTKHDVMGLYGAGEEKISVVYSGVNPSPYKGEGKVRLSKYNLPPKFLLFLGTLEPRKNVPSIIRAFTAIANSIPQDLVIAGTPGWLAGAIDRAIAEAAPAIRQRIYVPGFIAEEDKTALYAAADVFVYPSFYEGFGFPPLEALLAGTPVITSFNSALPEVVGEWATLVDPYNVSELALVMKELALDLPEVTEATKQQIREKYSWDVAATQTIQVLEDVV